MSIIDLLPILAPTPPQAATSPQGTTPPQGSGAPRPPNAPLADPKELVRSLAKQLHDGKRDDVVKAVEILSAADLDTVEAILIGALSNDKNKEQGRELRRIIRFVRYKPPPRPSVPAFTVSGGVAATKKPVKVSRGAVTIRKGVHVELGPSNKSDEAYSLTYKGPDAAEMRWLQFIWRRVVPESPSTVKGGKPRRKPVKMRLDNPSGPNRPYYLTTSITPDLSKDPPIPRWNTDSPATNSAFYDTVVKRSAGELAMFDFPSPMPTQGLAASLFKSANPPSRVIADFHASTYLVRGMDVLYRAEIRLTWEFTSASTPPVKVEAKAALAKEIESAQRAGLAIQRPEVDYLPGPPIGAPQPADDFDAVPDLPANKWDNKTNIQRYEDIAALAHAEMVRDVTGMSAQSINSKAKHVPGLNYSTKLSVEGETGYIDAKGDYHNPDVPMARDGPLPGVAIILGSGAFSWGGKSLPRPKAFALATMRHEMMHGIQEQLAIGWMLKWRDELTARSFSNWLTEERTRKRISDADFAVVSSGISPFDLAAIEVLAWTEGFVAALPFLPAQPQFSQMMPKEMWPGAVSALQGAGDFFNKMSSKTGGEDIRKAALDRIHRVICNDLTQAQRDALKVWIPFLLDPGSLNPTTDSDKEAVKLINGFFTPLKDFLKAVLGRVTKPCLK